jgi:hypothetical protein
VWHPDWDVDDSTGISSIDTFLASVRLPGLGEFNDEILFHYTSVQGLKGIVADSYVPQSGAASEKGSLWATDMRYLNDPGEYAYAFDLARERIQARRHSEPQREPELTAFVGRLEAWRHYPVYMASFTRDPDNLAMWRAYGHGDEGYAIGFHVDETVRHGMNPTRFQAPDGNPPPRHGLKDYSFYPCLYDRHIQERAMDELLDQALIDPDVAVTSFRRIAPMFKHRKYAGESEWRIALPQRFHEYDRPLSDYRCQPGTLIPFRRIPVGPGGLRIMGLVVGPNRHKEMAQLALRGFASLHDLQGYPILLSQIPFRRTNF